MSLHDVVRDLLPGVLSDLGDLVAIESVSADRARASEVERSALAIVGLLVDAGCPDARIVRANGGAPAVIARFPAPAAMPTVCLYAHHDVQPEGDPAGWATPPFMATEVNGRLYGSGPAAGTEPRGSRRGCLRDRGLRQLGGRATGLHHLASRTGQLHG